MSIYLSLLTIMPLVTSVIHFRRIIVLYCIVKPGAIPGFYFVRPEGPQAPPTPKSGRLGCTPRRARTGIAELILWTLAAIATVRVSFRSDYPRHPIPRYPVHDQMQPNHPHTLVLRLTTSFKGNQQSTEGPILYS